jgi:primary-amine oxidase
MHRETLSVKHTRSRRTTHALEPLGGEEITQVVALLKTLTRFNSSTRVISIILEEPTKERILDESSTDPIDREALAVCFDNTRNRAFQVRLNLSSNRCTSVADAPEGAQPTMSIDEQVECEQAVLRSPEFLAALRKHCGDVDPSLVMVDIWSAGNYGSKEDTERRLARPLCFLRADPMDNGYARPIEGIRPVVDLNKMEVLRVEDYGTFPLPPNEGNYSD